MKKVISVVLLTMAVLLLNASMINAQLYYPTLEYSYQYFNYNAPFFNFWQSPFFNTYPWSFKGTEDLKIPYWQDTSLYLKSQSVAEIKPWTFDDTTGQIITSFTPSFYIYNTTGWTMSPYGMPLIDPFNINNLRIRPISPEIAYHDIMNPESPLYYLNPLSPYYGEPLPERGLPIKADLFR